MNTIADINIFQLFVPLNLLSPYKCKQIRLLSLTVEKEMETFSKSFIMMARFEF